MLRAFPQGLRRPLGAAVRQEPLKLRTGSLYVGSHTPCQGLPHLRHPLCDLVCQWLWGLAGGAFERAEQVFGPDLRLDQLSCLPVLGEVGGGLLRQAFDLGQVQQLGGGQLRLDLLLGEKLSGRNVQDSIHICLEGDLYLGYAPGCRGDAAQFEPAQWDIVHCQLPLSLEDVDIH